jgi:DNA-binding transcriptional LysR family regulator
MAYQDNATGDARRIELPPAVAISDSAALLPVLLGGAGIAYLPDFLARPYVADGRLVRLWPTAEGIETVIHAIYPSHRSLSAKVRVFIDALVASFDGLQR